MVRVRYITGTSSTHVTDACKPGMPQICQQLMKRQTEKREKERLTHILLPWTMGEAEYNFVLSEISVRSKERRTEMGRQ